MLTITGNSQAVCITLHAGAAAEAAIVKSLDVPCGTWTSFCWSLGDRWASRGRSRLVMTRWRWQALQVADLLFR